MACGSLNDLDAPRPERLRSTWCTASQECYNILKLTLGFFNLSAAIRGSKPRRNSSRSSVCVTMSATRLVSKFKNFLSPTKTFIFEIHKNFYKIEEFLNYHTRFNKNFWKIQSTFIFIAISILTPVLWRHQTSDLPGPLTTGP